VVLGDRLSSVHVILRMRIKLCNLRNGKTLFVVNNMAYYYTIQYKNYFYSAVIKGAEALAGRPRMVQRPTAVKQMSLQMFF